MASSGIRHFVKGMRAILKVPWKPHLGVRLELSTDPAEIWLRGLRATPKLLFGAGLDEADLAERAAADLLTAARSLMALAKSLDPKGKRFDKYNKSGSDAYQATVSGNSQDAGVLDSFVDGSSEPTHTQPLLDSCSDCRGHGDNKVRPESPESQDLGETKNEI